MSLSTVIKDQLKNIGPFDFIKVKRNDEYFVISFDDLITIIETKSIQEKEFIFRTISESKLMNRNILEFLEFLASSYFSEEQQYFRRDPVEAKS